MQQTQRQNTDMYESQENCTMLYYGKYIDYVCLMKPFYTKGDYVNIVIYKYYICVSNRDCTYIIDENSTAMQQHRKGCINASWL